MPSTAATSNYKRQGDPRTKHRKILSVISSVVSTRWKAESMVSTVCTSHGLAPRLLDPP